MSRRFFSFSPFLWKSNRSLQTMTINYSIRLQILFFWGREIYLENDYNFPLGENAYSATKSDHRVDHRCPRFSPARNNTRSSSPLSTNERNIAREKVREKEERGNYYYYYCYLEKLPGNSTRVKGKKGEFFLFYKILVNNCGAIARGAKKKKRPLTIHDNRFLSATVRAVQPLPSPFNGKGTPSTVTSTLVTALVTGRIGRHQRLKESI